MPEGGAPWMRGVNDDSDFDQIIAEAKGTGAIGIKIYADLGFENVQKIVRESHAQEMKVWAHSCVFPARPSEVCQAGVDVMSHATYMAWEGEHEIPLNAKNRHRKHEHFNVEDPVFLSLIKLMEENQTILDATLDVYKRNFPDSTLFQYGVSLTKLAYEHKVKIGIGTDEQIADLNVPAPIFSEMITFQEDVGMEPIEIIQAATIVNAEMIGEMDRIGSVEVGKRANLLILKENPAEDIHNLILPEVVIKNGKMYNTINK
jgi:imidazolonepropionase-like amidohydrolase